MGCGEQQYPQGGRAIRTEFGPATKVVFTDAVLPEPSLAMIVAAKQNGWLEKSTPPFPSVYMGPAEPPLLYWIVTLMPDSGAAVSPSITVTCTDARSVGVREAFTVVTELGLTTTGN